MSAASRTGSPKRLDIQVLRAAAVGMVLLYHLWPNRFPGGFVGVDVFFVISGVLITSHLLRDAERDGVRLARFWSARMRRLLPLAMLVLLATTVAAWLVAPASQLPAILRNVVGSALYVQNWMLAGSSVDYLARDDAPLPTQHYWSLSAEEQFYVVWPLLVVAATAIAVRLARRSGLARRIAVRRAVAVAIAVVLVASLVHGIVWTATDPGPAYLATTTRAWEFAVGGLLAFVVDRSASPPATARGVAWRTAIAWVGVALLVGTTLLLADDVPYPGVAALLPVAGVALLLLAGDVGRWFAPSALTRVRPVTWLGDASYGVYLWHWPLIVLVPFAIGRELDLVAKLAIVATTLALAEASRRLVEDPVRFGAFWSARAARGFAVGAAATALVVGTASVGLVAIAQERAAAESAIADAIDAGLDAPPAQPGDVVVPPIGSRIDDTGGMFSCFDYLHAGAIPCEVGDADGTLRIALVGDSHAAHLVPGIAGAAQREGWSVTTFVGMNCDAGLSATECPAGATALERIDGGEFDLVVAAGFRDSGSPLADVEAFWDRLRAGETPVLLVGDVPMHPESAYARHASPRRYSPSPG